MTVDSPTVRMNTILISFLASRAIAFRGDLDIRIAKYWELYKSTSDDGDYPLCSVNYTFSSVILIKL